MNECLLKELKDERKLAKGRAQAGHHSRQSVPSSPRGSLEPGIIEGGRVRS